ncbi:MAG TPA: glycogen synthase GlgA [Vicinamibacterales bacterium]|nr:glycogen synthase GlgA [Vicinamibacterales bacterium]
MIASEVVPYSKTGGLADVLGGLPTALAAQGHDVTVVTPRYRGQMPRAQATSRPVEVGTTAVPVTRHVASVGPRHRVVFIESAAHFDRPGLYGEGGRDYDDNAERFALLAAAALDFAEHDAGVGYDIVHGHDWQAALAPALLVSFPFRWPRLHDAGRVLTIHNLAYQGLFARDTVPAIGLPWSVFTMDTGEFWGQFSFLKTGIVYSDWVTTVSPTYAQETLTSAAGCGLDGVLASRGDRYLGILNGIDDEVWDPAHDRHLPATYSAADLSGKRACKRALLARFGLPQGDDALERPLVGMVSRLVDQKGIDLIKAASPTLMGLDATWVFVGTGEARYERWLQHLSAVHPSRVGALVGFDEGLAHLVEAGADVFLMPSRFEPSGLNQMYSLRYGTVPVVHGVGGLDDTVRPYTARAQRANGFKFREPTAEALVRTVRHALRLYRRREVWRRLVRQGMSEDHSWSLRAGEYVKVYRRARHEHRRARIQGE